MQLRAARKEQPIRRDEGQGEGLAGTRREHAAVVRELDRVRGLTETCGHGLRDWQNYPG
jgi:hypothetical protein